MDEASFLNSKNKSDPYVKIKIDNKDTDLKTSAKDQNLNPVWNEKFSLPINDHAQSVQVRP